MNEKSWDQIEFEEYLPLKSGYCSVEQLDFALVWGEGHGAETPRVLFVTGPDPEPKQSTDSHKTSDYRYTTESSCLF